MKIDAMTELKSLRVKLNKNQQMVDELLTKLTYLREQTENLETDLKSALKAQQQLRYQLSDIESEKAKITRIQ